MNLTDYNEIRALLARHKFRFSKSMGQNFLTAAWVPEDIAASAMLDEETGVLEIGPGVGCLTQELSKRAGKVLCVELDKALKPILAETLSDCENVEIVFGNVLKQDLPELMEEHQPGMRHAVCANLPYNITSPVLTALIEGRMLRDHHRHDPARGGAPHLRRTRHRRLRRLRHLRPVVHGDGAAVRCAALLLRAAAEGHKLRHPPDAAQVPARGGKKPGGGG